MDSQRLLICGALALALAAAPLAAQGIGQNQIPGLWLPNASPGAEVAQTVGLTNIRITYHRPAVNERTIWGGLVPWGQVWRTGANENTLISFSHDVKVEGQALPAGTYGLHTLPGEEEWQIIFSHDNTAWGSFSYDQSRDALRVTVQPQEGEHQERMLFTFDQPDNDSVTVALRWEKLRVPFRVEVDTPALVLASIRDQLKGLSQFTWIGWNQAATYCLQNDLNLEEALGWTDNSIQAEERFDNLSTKAQILAKLDRDEESAQVLAHALEVASPLQMHGYGRQLLAQGKKEEAMKVFQDNAERNPDAWFIGVGLARGHAAFGRFEEAAQQMRVALEAAPENQKTYIQGLVEQLERGENI